MDRILKHPRRRDVTTSSGVPSGPAPVRTDVVDSTIDEGAGHGIEPTRVTDESVAVPQRPDLDSRGNGTHRRDPDLPRANAGSAIRRR